MLRTPRSRALFILALAMLVAGMLYAPELEHPFLWDDNVQIAENPAVTNGVPCSRYFLDRDTTSTRKDYNTRIYRPLRNLAMRGLWRLGDRAPSHHAYIFHLASLVLYLVGGVLVFLLARRLSRDEVAAALGASVWLLLPVHAEDILYASAFGDVLSMVLQLGGLWYAMRALDENGRRVDVIASVVLFALAMLVKEMAVTSVLLVPAYIASERSTVHDKSLRARALALCVLHVIVAVGYFVLRTILLGRVGQDDLSWFTLGWALAQLPRLVLFNLEVTLMPLGHAPDYGGPFTNAILAVLSALALGLALWFALRHSRLGARFGALLFVIALAPVLQILPMWTLLADRFLLVPSVGIALLVAALIASTREGRPYVISVVVICTLVSVAGLSLERRRFQDELTFWTYATEAVGDSALAHQNLGVDYLKHLQPKPALNELVRSYQLGRREPRLLLFMATGFEGIGNYAKAEQAAREAIALDANIPMAYAQLASILRHRGDAAGALAAITEGQRRGLPPYLVAKEHASALRADPSQQEEALKQLRALSRENPDDMMTWAELGDVALRLGLRDEALAAVKHCGVLPACMALGAQIDKPSEPAP